MGKDKTTMGETFKNLDESMYEMSLNNPEAYLAVCAAIAKKIWPDGVNNCDISEGE